MDRATRHRAMTRRWRELRQIRRERAADPTGTDPGWSTGILKRTVKWTRDRRYSWEEYRIDSELFREMLALDALFAQGEGHPAFAVRTEDPWTTLVAEPGLDPLPVLREAVLARLRDSLPAGATMPEQAGTPAA